MGGVGGGYAGGRERVRGVDFGGVRDVGRG